MSMFITAKCRLFNQTQPDAEIALRVDGYAAITYGSDLRIGKAGEDSTITIRTLPAKILITPEYAGHKLWLNLCHGRETLEEDMEDTGYHHDSTEGYTGAPVADAIMFLKHSVNMITLKPDGTWEEVCIPIIRGMVFYEGNYYGDYSADNDGRVTNAKAEQDGVSPTVPAPDATTAGAPAADPAAVIPPTDQGA